jgi:hypothetical protein
MNCKGVLSLSTAATFLFFLGPNYAQARAVDGPSAKMTMATPRAGHREAMRMVPARADLMKALDARDIRAGQQFEAKLSRTIRLKNGLELRRGTELLGHVVADKMRNDGETSSLVLRFSRAKVKGGKMIPIKATIVGLYPPDSEYWTSYDDGATPNNWTSKTLQVDQLNVLRGVDLHSKIAARNSGVLVSKKKDNMKIAEGSEFALAIAERGAGRKNANVGSRSGAVSKRGA